MTTEEKAKAYEMALEAARKELGVDRKEYKVVEQVLKSIFPELRESEDERVIKELETFLNQPEIAEKITFEARIMWLSWLEVQKEQKKDNPLEDFSKGYNAGYYHGRTDNEQKPAWSEEDELTRISVIQTLERLGVKNNEKEINWLKSLRPVKQEWSEEDERIACTILNLLCSQVTYVTGQGTTSGKQFPTYAKERDWFEKRFKSLRPHWKPSEEQMEALEECGECKRCIKELYEQLKKL